MHEVTLFRKLEEENVFISAEALYNLIWKFFEQGEIVDLPRRKKDL